MGQEELEKLLEGVSKKHKDYADGIRTEIKRVVDENFEKTLLVDKLEDSLKGLGVDPGALKELTDAVKKQGDEMRKLMEKRKEEEVKTLKEVIAEKAEDLKTLSKAPSGSVRLTINKDIFKTTVQRSAITDSTLAMRLQSIGQLPYLDTIMSGLFRHVPLTGDHSGNIRYIDQKTITRNAATVAEGASKPESAITWQEYTFNVEKVADTIPVTREALMDVGFIRGELERLLQVNLALEEDSQLWDGDGVTPNLKGIYTYTSAFNHAAYAGFKADNATLYDLLAILRVQVTNGKGGKYSPNVVVMNPADTLRYKLAKGTDGHYVLPPFVMENGQQIDGMLVRESSQVTANTLALGDFRFGTVYDVEDITVDIGYVNDQFKKNMLTMLAEKREGLLVRNADLDAFLKVTDIDAAVLAVTA